MVEYNKYDDLIDSNHITNALAKTKGIAYENEASSDGEQTDADFITIGLAIASLDTLEIYFSFLQKKRKSN